MPRVKPASPNRPHPLSVALRQACLGLALSTPVLLPAAALAQTGTPQAAPRHYDIPAGPLGTTLSRFAGAAGVVLSFDASLTAGKESAGLQGSFSVPAGFARLLEASGLEALPQGSGNYLLRRLPPRNSSETTLGEVQVSASAPGEPTENTGAYTSRSTSTATRLPMSLRETPQSVSVITRQRIEDENLTSVETLLDRTPGISVQNLGTSRYGILSRGYSIDNYQFDGVLTAADTGTQNVPQSQADLVIYDRVEILRGATGLLTGAGDPSGTINMIRKKPSRAFQGHVGAGIGSWNRSRLELDVAGPINAAGTLRGRFVGAHEEGDTHIDHYQQKRSVLYGVLEADLSERTLLTAGLEYQNNDPRGGTATGMPLFYSDGRQTRFSPSENAGARWNRDQLEGYNAFAHLEHRLTDNWSVKLSANHLYSKRSFAGADASWGFPDRDSGDGVRLYGGMGSAVQRQTGFDANIQGSFEAWGRRHDLVLGFNWSDYDNQHEPAYDDVEGRSINLFTWDNQTAKPQALAEKLMDYDSWMKQYGSYAALRLRPRDDLALILGARSSSYRYRLSNQYALAAFAPYSSVTEMREDGVVTPYAGIVYDLNDSHALYASYTSIFKPQSVRDRNGAVLDPREGDNYEIGLKSEFFGGRLTTAVALYQIRQNNLAEEDVGHTVPGTSPVQTAYRAVSGTRTQGVDMELNGELLPGWQLGASYNYSSTEDAAGERIRTTFPRHMAKLWTAYRLPGQWNRLTLGGGVNWQSRIYYSGTDWQLPGVTLKGEQPAYSVVNLMARYEISKQLSATLNINNLFDKEYLQGLDSTFHTGIYAPTRNAMLNLRYNF